MGDLYFILRFLCINFNLGQMEKTMMKTFLSMASLHNMLQDTNSIKDLEPLIAAASDCYGDTALIREFLTREDNASLKLSSGKREQLDFDLEASVQKRSSPNIFSNKRFYQVYKSCQISGVTYNIFTKHLGNSLIFMKVDNTTGNIAPAVIRAIFSHTETDKLTDLYFAVHQYQVSEAQANESLNPFLRYPDFQLSLWSTEKEANVQVISASQVVCHAVRRLWKEGVYVFRPLNRVCRNHIPMQEYYSLLPRIGKLMHSSRNPLETRKSVF